MKPCGDNCWCYISWKARKNARRRARYAERKAAKAAFSALIARPAAVSNETATYAKDYDPVAEFAELLNREVVLISGVSKVGANIKATVTLHFDDEYLSNILITSFDSLYGGCWYWAEPKGPNWLVTEGGVWKSCTVREKEASDDSNRRKWAVVDHAMVARGLQRILQRPGHDKMKAKILAKDDDLDAADVDVVVQFAMFGEEVYG